MIPFLKAVAEGYAARYTDFRDFLFVFPNRRSCTFFMKHFKEAVGRRSVMLPQTATMADFAESLSGRVVANQTELLFMLYLAYAGYLKEEGVKEPPAFDIFRRWGETALSDFNEVDMHCIDADSIFKNVRDIKEISANFLTEEQMKVMEEYFGQVFDPKDVSESFWKSFIENEDDEVHSRFRLLWQVLAPLYHRLDSELEQKGLATSGGSYRLAAERLEDEETGVKGFRKVVMVGFNALTASEDRIFRALQGAPQYPGPDGPEPYADFFWDATGPVLTDPDNSASKYVGRNIRKFPAPEWGLECIRESDTDSMPDTMRVIAVPSNSAQAKVIGEELERIKGEVTEEDLRQAKVAVVLPDEGLLLPLLYSLPEDIGDVNLTMGYPLRHTSTASFISLLRKLQHRRRKTHGETGYYYKDLNLLLSHPFSHALLGSPTVGNIKEWIREHHKAIITIGDIEKLSETAALYLRPLDDNTTPEETAAYLDNVLSETAKAVEENGGAVIKGKLDKANIDVYRQELSKLKDTVKEYGIDMKWQTFMSLTDRMLATRTVTFEGQPLSGLQVMGILETRALDFERIIIPSLNERILPARARSRSFISDSLRRAYGLPPMSYSESLFSYYFYRMISRAKEVVMLYDSRASEGARSGDVSRYVLQLQYIHARERLRRETRSFMLSKADTAPSPIEKTGPVMDMLEGFSTPDPEGRNLSATALTKYAACQLKFYYEELLRIRTDETASEYIDPITQGSIIHDVMQRIYLPEDKQHIYLTYPVIIDGALVRQRIDDREGIGRLVRRAVNKMHFHLPDDELDRELRGSAKYVAEVLEHQIDGILRFDLKQTPFTLYGVEIEENVILRMPDGRNINMRFAIDRLDDTEGSLGRMQRIVDYKTGTVHAEAETIDSIFTGDYHAKNLLQLYLYANLFDALPDKNPKKDAERQVLRLFDEDSGLPNRPMALELYNVPEIRKGEHVYPVIEKERQMSHAAANDEFLSRLKAMLEEIFNPEVPFRPTENPENCDMCPFKMVCHR